MEMKEQIESQMQVLEEMLDQKTDEPFQEATTLVDQAVIRVYNEMDSAQ